MSYLRWHQVYSLLGMENLQAAINLESLTLHYISRYENQGKQTGVRDTSLTKNP